jgi:hypothetical protein
MNRFVLGAIAFALSVPTPLRAQAPSINDLKSKIFDAQMAQQMFGGALRHCSELNGTNFYFQPHDRVLDLQQYSLALQNMVEKGEFNPDTKRPWTGDDANARWEQVKKQATIDQATCALVASLPDLQKQLDDLQKQQSAASETKN